MVRVFVFLFFFITLRIFCVAQCNFIPSTSTSIDTLSYSFSGGTFASYGCAPIDPTFWLSGYGDSVTITFVNPESFPSIRVWGINIDDTAIVLVNNINYPLTGTSASYDSKVVCGVSPGPDGIIFSNGKITGCDSSSLGNYSYQNVTINDTNITSITVVGISGAGWGFAGATVCQNSLVPVAGFTSTATDFCQNFCIDFMNNSLNSTSYQWFFPGATPAYDTAANPHGICYFNTGTYDVTLIAVNSNAADTLLLTNYITIFPQIPFVPLSQIGDTLFSIPGYSSYQWYNDSTLIAGATDYYFVALHSGNYSVQVTDSNGCNAVATMINVIAATNELLSTAGDFTSNYNSGIIHLNIKAKNVSHSMIQLIDITGKMIFSNEFPLYSTENKIDIPLNISDGIYLIKIQIGDHFIAQKIIVR